GEASVSRSESTPPTRRLSRRSFLRAAGLSSAALGLLACAPAAQQAPAPTAAPPKPAEAAKPTAPAAAPTPAPAAASSAPASKPAEAAKPTEAAKPAAAAKPGETPQRGGELIYVVSAEPDTFDGHKSTTFANIHPIAPHYNTLVKFDPDAFPQM